MNILIITTYYPPDTTIAAVRPYMYAKYLSRLGHTVTVLRSGLIHETADRFFEKTPDVRVISYLGENAPSERFERGEIAAPKKHQRHNRLFRVLTRLYRRIIFPFLRSKSGNLQEEIENNLALQKMYINRLADESEHFDVVVATYCEMENAYAGEYASETFGCKWIMDFRDPMAQKDAQIPEVYEERKKLQNYFIEKADLVVSVSKESLINMCRGLRVAKAAVLYNGYEELPHNKLYNPAPNVLTLCYTGQLYERQAEGVTVLLKALKSLLDKGAVQKDKICVKLAGQNVNIITQKAKKMKIGYIFEDYGYVDREKVNMLQNQSDIFLLFNWNTINERGGITGKFYEGIRAQKPILSLIAGTVPNSELYKMNETYHYGFCYECCREDQFGDLCDYIAQAYRQKMAEGTVHYEPASELALDFRYDNLAKKLNDLCEEIVNG